MNGQTNQPALQEGYLANLIDVLGKQGAFNLLQLAPNRMSTHPFLPLEVGTTLPQLDYFMQGQAQYNPLVRLGGGIVRGAGAVAQGVGDIGQMLRQAATAGRAGAAAPPLMAASMPSRLQLQRPPQPVAQATPAAGTPPPETKPKLHPAALFLWLDGKIAQKKMTPAWEQRTRKYFAPQLLATKGIPPEMVMAWVAKGPEGLMELNKTKMEMSTRETPQERAQAQLETSIRSMLPRLMEKSRFYGGVFKEAGVKPETATLEELIGLITKGMQKAKPQAVLPPEALKAIAEMQQENK